MDTEYLTIDELSEYLKIPKSTLYKMTTTKKIPCVKIGRQLRFRKSAIDNWVEKQEISK
ncbi:MAG: helix-turn-helix domain-containing protein [Candidatus Omnitrophica bacterium]|nr:helix-turn-helix domain-containing protein [Candidatus Omnitrophota bacterium]